MIPSPLAAVIFDMDGVLLDTEALYRTALFETCAGLGYEMTDAVHLSLIGSPLDAASRTLAGYFGPGFPIELCLERCRVSFTHLCRDSMPVRAGARALLEFLKRQGIPTGLATSTRREPAEAHLSHAALIDLIDVRVTRSDVTHGKPHPESFLTAAERLGADPRYCLALEDSYAGVRAATAAGMATIMVPDMLPPTDEMRALCVAVFETLGQVHAELRDHLEQGRYAA